MENIALLHNSDWRRNPFNVPKGYFESLEERIMSTIPSGETKSVRIAFFTRKRKLVMAAAIICGLLFCSVLWLGHGLCSENNAEVASHTKMDGSSAVDDMVDYMMLDGDDMYLYMAEN